MRRLARLVLLVLAGCSPAASMPDAASVDANRVCGVPLQLEITLADRGDCAAPPIVMLVTDGAGAVVSASARVPVGVTVPSIACAAAPPALVTPACTWPLSLHCEGPNGERIDLDGTLTGSDHAWTSSALAVTLIGLPPPRLTCTATASATTR